MVFFLSHPTQLPPPSCPPIRMVPDRQKWPWRRLCSRRKGKSRSCLYFISGVIARVEKKRKRSSAAEVVRFEFKVNERELQLLFWSLMQPPVHVISRYVRERSSGKYIMVRRRKKWVSNTTASWYVTPFKLVRNWKDCDVYACIYHREKLQI
jgi:hypothetical protein